MASTVSIWWPGETVDHLYAECPNLRRLQPQPSPSFSAIDPEGGDVCGTCLRWWRARNPASTSDVTVVPTNPGGGAQ